MSSYFLISLPKLLLYFSDPPKVRLSLGSSIDPKAISEGNDVYMDCEIRANPKAYKVEWSHNVRKKIHIKENEKYIFNVFCRGYEWNPILHQACEF